MADTTSPFAGKRYEYSGSHVYFIPHREFEKLEADVPTFVVGTRGTGKTTLLKALDWEERLYNRWLRDQLGGHIFEKGYIGLYFKLPNMQLDLLEKWLIDADDPDYGAIVAFYLDLCWLEAAAPAVKHLEAHGVITLDPPCQAVLRDELAALWRDYPAVERLLGPVGDTISDVLHVMHPLRRAVERFARRRALPDDVIDALPIGQIGSFGRTLGKAIARCIRPRSEGPDRWSFRVCMDEGEALTLRQQRTINSMIRLAEWPVFYVVAYVSRPPDVTGTFIPNQTLQLADRQILLRDQISDKEFRELAEGVVNVRLKAQGHRRNFNVGRSFGKLDINALLEAALDESVSETVMDLLRRARADVGADVTPPIYQTYLRDRRPELHLEPPQTRAARRRASSATIRKQMVAAYLSICKEANVEPLYASADMVLQVSDKCVRDFLWQVEAVQTASQYALDKFLSEQVPVEHQSRGLRDAARQKMALFREKVISAPTEANQLVDALAKVTAVIQSFGRNLEQIRTPERGIFTYVPSRAGSVTDENEVLIRDAAAAGFLKLVGDDDDELQFRVHASLSPYFNFSYRGAYYPACALSPADVRALRAARTDRETALVVAKLAERVTGRRLPKEMADQLDLGIARPGESNE